MTTAGWASPANAAISHDFLKQITTVPATGPHGEAVPVPGPLEEMNSMTVDSGSLWIAEQVAQGTFRVDQFDSSSGAFVSQLPQVPALTNTRLGVAVGHLAGSAQVYVGAESVAGNEGRVAVFSEAGVLLGTWTGANTVTKTLGEGQLTGVAVDNSLGSPAAGDVYVSIGALSVSGIGAPRVDVFKPKSGEAPGAEPTEVTDLLGTCPTEDSVCEPAEVIDFTRPKAVSVDPSTGDVAVVDARASGDVVDVFRPEPPLGVYRFLFSIAGAQAGEPFFEVNNVAVDGSSGEIYVVHGAVVDQFTAAGVFRGRLKGTSLTAPFNRPESVAVDSATGELFVGDRPQEGGGVVDVFAAGVVIPDVTTAAATGQASSSAVLHGTVDALGESPATCVFVWGTTKAFGHSAPCPAPVEGSGPVNVEAPLTGLQPDTTYFYRLQATNANGTNPGEESEDQQFQTVGPGIPSESVSEVSSTSATLNGEVNPDGAPTTAYFQYSTASTTGCEANPAACKSTPAAPGEALGSASEPVTLLPRHIQELLPTTTYHYRLVVQSPVAPGVFYGPDQTFTTQAAEPSFSLPDARRWEQVSPQDKHGAVVLPIEVGAITQAEATGGGLSYLATVPTEADAHGYSETEYVLSSRQAPGKWSSPNISLPHATPPGVSVGNGTDYRVFSPDLSLAIAESQNVFTSLAPEVSPPDSERTPYLRHNNSCLTTPNECFTPLLTGAPGYANVPEGTHFGGAVRFVGASPDLQHVVLRSNVALTSTPSEASSLYEWSAGRPAGEPLKPVSVLPESEGGAIVEAELGSAEIGGLAHAINASGAVSTDGSRVFWSARKNTVPALYLRDLSGAGVSLRLDAVQGGSGSGVPGAFYQGASADGSRVFFTDQQQLTADSGARAEQADLYECVIVEDRCQLTDLTPAVGGVGAAVQGVVGSSGDGSYVYFVASGAVAAGANPRGETPVQGAPALYMLHYDAVAGTWGTPGLVGVLSEGDSPDWGDELEKRTARVSPAGGWLAFMSERPLTGYDNHDAVSGKLDEEVFLYHATDGRLVCASCDPTGARPTGEELTPEGSLIQPGVPPWNGRWLGANVPGWTPYELSAAGYQSRYLSDSGRMFFNTGSALVPADGNHNQDVYEFEPAGEGGCSTSTSSGGVVYVPSSGGCVGLISSGAASGESAFLDASETGGDVFFLTAGKLTTSDVDTALDVYDAHVCSTGAPCASLSSAPPSCSTAESCRAAPTPQPSIFGAPSSATFSGPGNLTPTPPGPKGKTAAQIRAGKLARALKACRRKHNRHRRQVCERQAHKRYGPPKSHSRSKSRKGGK